MGSDINLSFGTLDKSDFDSYSDYVPSVTKEQLKESDIYVLGAFNDDTDELVGAAVIRSVNPAELLSITVAGPYRNRGIGDAMIIHMIEALSDAGIEGMSCIIPEDGKAYITGTGLFFWRCGFSPVKRYSDFSFSLKSAGKNEKLGRIIEEWSDEGYEPAPALFSEEGKALLELLPADPKPDDMDYSPSFSTVYKEDGSLVGCLLVSEEDGFFLVNILYETKGYATVIYSMIVRTLMAIAEAYNDETELRFIGAFDQLEALYSYIFPKEAGKNCQTLYVLPFNRNYSEKKEHNDTDISEEFPASVNDTEKPQDYEDEIKLPKALDDDADPEDNEDDDGSEDVISHFADDPVLRPVTDEELYCRNCLYRLGGVESGACHKYDRKPDEIINGGICDRFYAERRK